MKRIAIGGLHTECSSYAPLQQVASDFTRVSGQALIDLVPFDFQAAGLMPVPLFHDRSVPGEPVSTETFRAQVTEFMSALRAAGPLDGVLLLMHGAMFVPGIDDPEGWFITQVRDIVGPDAIMSASFDLHGQITQQIVDGLDAFAAYRTAPHIDVPHTYARAAAMLSDALNGGPRPLVCWTPVPILVSGEMSSTFVAPCDALYQGLPQIDTRPGVCDGNLMIGYVWADSPRATAAAVVTAIDRDVGQAAANDIAAQYHAARDQLTYDMEACGLDTALDRIDTLDAILADSGDNPTAGGVGDRADVLQALLMRKASGALVAGIADPKAYGALSNGASEVSLGGSLGGGGPRMTLSPDDCRFANDCAIATVDGVTLIITKRRRPFHNLSDFSELGLSLDAFPLLVVKSGYLSPELRPLPRRQIMALTDGAVCQDILRLENNHRPSGTWPFDALTPST